MNLVEILATMDIPDMRRDVSKPENVRWLIRNIGIRNSNNSFFAQALILLTSLDK